MFLSCGARGPGSSGFLVLVLSAMRVGVGYVSLVQGLILKLVIGFLVLVLSAMRIGVGHVSLVRRLILLAFLGLVLSVESDGIDVVIDLSAKSSRTASTLRP